MTKTKPPLPDHTHNTEAERAVLAPILDGRHPDAWPSAIEILGTPLAFYAQAHQIIAIACEGLTADGTHIEGLTISEWLSSHTWGDVLDRIRELDGATGRKPKISASDVAYEDSALAAIGGHVVLGDLAATFGPIATLPRHAKTVAEHYRQREALRAARALVDALSGPAGARTAPETIPATVAHFERIMSPVGRAGTLSQGLDDSLASHDAVAAGAKVIRSAVTGVASIDEAMPMCPRGMTILAAAPGAGKTSLALQTIRATCKAFGPGSVAVYSGEMGISELATVMLAAHLQVPYKAVRDGQLSMGQRDQADVVRKEIESWNVHVRVADGSPVQATTAWAKRIHRSGGGHLRLLIVDHIALFGKSFRNQQTYDRISEASLELKKFANMTGPHVLGLCQMSREGRKGIRGKHGDLSPDPEPQMSDLKGSGDIEQDADNVIFLYRPTLEITQGGARKLMSKLAKNRFDAQVKLPLEFHVTTGQRFTEPNMGPPERDDKPTRHERMNQPTANDADLPF